MHKTTRALVLREVKYKEADKILTVLTEDEGKLAVAARSGEIVEAIEHRSMPVAAVQYHPERMTGRERFAEHGPDTAPLFAWFVQQCMDGKKQ